MARESGVRIGILGYTGGTRPVRSTPNLAPNQHLGLSKERLMCNSNVPSLHCVPPYYRSLAGHRKPAFYAMWQATGYRCWYCGEAQIEEWQTEDGSEFVFDDWGLEIDHFHPRSKGGSNDKTNLVPACKSCNRLKSAKSIEEFRAAWIADIKLLVPAEFWTEEPLVFAFEEHGWVAGAY